MFAVFFWHTKHSNSSPLRNLIGIGGTRRWPDLGSFVIMLDRTELNEFRRRRAPGLMYSAGSESGNLVSSLSKTEGATEDFVV
jgi:hypothetical protein